METGEDKPAADPNGPWVLVIEDSRMVQLVTLEVLSREGLRAEGARSGAEARQRLQGGLPACVVLDLQLPDVDGFLLAEELKGDPRTSAIPIVVVSGRDHPTDRDRALSIGCSDYMVKPVDIQVFGARLKELMGSGEAATD